MPDQNFFAFVVNLVKLGGLGIGALIFVMAFIILLQNKPADAGMARFRTSFLQWGAGFAVLALAASLLTSWLQRPVAGPLRVRLGVTVSPDFGEAKLPEPNLTLMPSGTRVKPDGFVDVNGDSTLNIEVRGIVQSVKDLAQSSSQLLDTNRALTTALDQSSTAVATARQQQQAQQQQQQQQAENQGVAPPPVKPVAVPAAAVPVLSPQELATIKASQSNISKMLASGDFRAAALSTNQLHTLTIAAPGLTRR